MQIKIWMQCSYTVVLFLDLDKRYELFSHHWLLGPQAVLLEDLQAHMYYKELE